MAMKELREAWIQSRLDEMTNRFSLKLMNHHTLQAYLPDFKLNHIVMFDKLVTLQVVFGTQHYFAGYSATRFARELRMSRETVEKLLSYFESVGILKVDKSGFVPRKRTYSYMVDLELLSSNPELVWVFPEGEEGDEKFKEQVTRYYALLNAKFKWKEEGRAQPPSLSITGIVDREKYGGISQSDDEGVF